jgi:hypothetical protein
MRPIDIDRESKQRNQRKRDALHLHRKDRPPRPVAVEWGRAVLECGVVWTAALIWACTAVRRAQIDARALGLGAVEAALQANTALYLLAWLIISFVAIGTPFGDELSNTINEIADGKLSERQLLVWTSIVVTALWILLSRVFIDGFRKLLFRAISGLIRAF